MFAFARREADILALKKYETISCQSKQLVSCLLLMDALPVPEDEMREAIYWKVKSLINFPMEEAVYDYFAVYLPVWNMVKLAH